MKWIYHILKLMNPLDRYITLATTHTNVEHTLESTQIVFEKCKSFCVTNIVDRNAKFEFTVLTKFWCCVKQSKTIWRNGNILPCSKITTRNARRMEIRIYETTAHTQKFSTRSKYSHATIASTTNANKSHLVQTCQSRVWEQKIE